MKRWFNSDSGLYGVNRKFYYSKIPLYFYSLNVSAEGLETFY